MAAIADLLDLVIWSSWFWTGCSRESRGLSSFSYTFVTLADLVVLCQNHSPRICSLCFTSAYQRRQRRRDEEPICEQAFLHHSCSLGDDSPYARPSPHSTAPTTRCAGFVEPARLGTFRVCPPPRRVLPGFLTALGSLSNWRDENTPQRSMLHSCASRHTCWSRHPPSLGSSSGCRSCRSCSCSSLLCAAVASGHNPALTSGALCCLAPTR